MGNHSPSFSVQINPPGREREELSVNAVRAYLIIYFFLTAFSITAHQRCDYCDSIRRGSTAGGNILRLITAQLSLIYCQKPARSPSCEVESSPGKWRGINREGGRLRWMADWLAGWLRLRGSSAHVGERTLDGSADSRFPPRRASGCSPSTQCCLQTRGEIRAPKEEEGGGGGEVVTCYTAGSHTNTHACTHFHASSAGNS